MDNTKTALEVIVDQKPGIINWNFEQLKTALAEKMKDYEGLVYTAETVPVAKADVATLRKLKKSVSDKRIEIKNKCLEPYEIIEEQAKELTELIDKPISDIARQLDEYEKNRKEEVKKEILAFMDKTYETLPEEIAVKLKEVSYDSRWENATATKKSWKTEIKESFGRIQGDLAVIDKLEDEFKNPAMDVYKRDLVLSAAMTKVTELRKQKEEILAREREKIAEEERRKAEQAVSTSEKGAITSIEPTLSKGQAIPPSVQDNTPAESTEPFFGMPEPIPPLEPKTQPAEATAPSKKGKSVYVLRISATPEQIARIKGYIEHAGAVYREEM